ncbi:MAG: LodA/GoxA family CTQ-dependent oxidase [Bdellovibrionales bacterium]|nr:LodA/GoxA family CTQ-dependent oxidase [Bdellovibrionales bacterium]
MEKLKNPSRRHFLRQSGMVAAASLLSRFAKANEENRIVRAKIHPGIGVARIGNSTEADGFFIGPEVVKPPFTQAGATRDKKGALKRQAARFRIYGYNAKGQVVKELTPDNATIQWQVHLANKKAAWYRFTSALDIPENEGNGNPRRNAKVKGEERKKLVIDPGARSISGKNLSGKAYQFNGGKFMGVEVPLGELRTDEKGRLVVLGGLGKSGTPSGSPPYDPTDGDTFNNADGWYDDTSDGPVRASVECDGEKIPVDPAWVIVGPPNYAPDVIGWRTLHDLLVHTYTASGWLTVPRKTSFTKDVYPLLQRLSNLQWVNKGLADTYGAGSDWNFDDKSVIAKLADKSQRAMRREVYDKFRVREEDSNERTRWPMFYGDAFGSFTDSPRNNFIVPELSSLHLKRWADGEYDNDWEARASAPPSKLEEVPLKQQPAELDKAALHFCLADAFHPGCELTWPMRHATVYSAPFRIKHRDTPEKDYGDNLTEAQIKKLDGPLHGQGPGDLSKWMAIPWQGDTVFCRSGYEPEFDPYLPTFWPARVPNHVLSEADYRIVVDARLPRAERLAAFKRRVNWVRHMKGSPPDQILQMVREFDKMGVIEARPGVRDDADFPAILFVETLPPELAKAFEAAVPKTRNPNEKPKPFEVAGWESAEQLEAFRKARGVKKR